MVVDGYPGLVRDVQTYLKERIRRCSPASSEAIVVRIYGPDLDVLREKAEEVKESCEIEGIIDLHVELQVRDPADRGRGRSRRGPALRPQAGRCPPGSGQCWRGEEVGDIFEGRAYDVHVWSTPGDPDSLTTSRTC